MKRLLIIILIITVLLNFAIAYDVGVESSPDDQIILSFSELNTLDIKISDLKATVETSTVSDSYIVDYTLSTSGDKILLIIDITPLLSDYSSIDSILISGKLNSLDFSKRVAMREDARAKQFAPSLESSTMIYWVIGIAVLLVLSAIYLLNKPSKSIKKKKVVKRKIKKKKKSKKKRL